MPDDERLKKLEEQFAQISDKLLKLEERFTKNADPDTRAKIEALTAELDKLRKKLEAAGGTPPPVPAPAAAPAPAPVKKKDEEKSFEKDLGLED